MVHDAVRPLVPDDLLAQALDACRVHGVASLATDLVSTIIRKDENNFLKETLVREEYMGSETPQVFKANLLQKAYEEVSSSIGLYLCYYYYFTSRASKLCSILSEGGGKKSVVTRGDWG